MGRFALAAFCAGLGLVLILAPAAAGSPGDEADIRGATFGTPESASSPIRRLSLSIGLNSRIGDGWMKAVDGGMGSSQDFTEQNFSAKHDSDNFSVPDFVLGYVVAPGLQIRFSRSESDMGASRYFSDDYRVTGSWGGSSDTGATYTFSGETTTYGVALNFLSFTRGLRAGAGITWNRKDLWSGGVIHADTGTQNISESIKNSSLGFLVETGVTLPTTGYWFFDFGVRYLYLGSETFGAKTVVVDEGKGLTRQFPATDISLNHFALEAAVGIGF